MLEPYAVKVARTVLRERGGGDTALLPGAPKIQAFHMSNLGIYFTLRTKLNMTTKKAPQI